MFNEIDEKNAENPLIDLSNATDDVLILILLRVPAKDLVKSCTKVSKQWNRVLARNFFWRDKMEQDGYRLEWQKLAGLSTESFKTIAVRRAFGRNFIKDSWDLSFRDGRCLKLDPRWDASSIVWQTRDDTERAWARIEIPPVFLDGQPDMPAELGEPIEACLAIGGFIPVRKSIVIKLSDEGLTDEIMDNFRPTIVVSEMVGNRRDFISIYEMIFSLKMNDNPEQMNNEGQSVHAAFNLRFAQWRAEGWNKVEHVFKEYPPGMRYLQIQCSGTVFHFRQGHYGIKLANCSVKALCEKNAPE